MGLIMLILIGTVPPAYALNHAVRHDQVQTFIAVSEKTEKVLSGYRQAGQDLSLDQQKAALEKAINARNVDEVSIGYLRNLVNNIKEQVAQYDSLSDIPVPTNRNVRNDMYLASETIRVMEKTKNRRSAYRRMQPLPTTRSKSTQLPSSFRTGSRLPWPWRLVWERWWAGSALS
jgi:inorganic phosphate transporter, PiT family